ncbi:hypothetical protein ACA910_006565 [Epithemia clementina (nom. ined.)]
MPAHVSYQTADNLAILPGNREDHVRAVAQSCDLDLDACFSVYDNNNKNNKDNKDVDATAAVAAALSANWKLATDVWFPMPITVRNYLTYYCDLTALP